MDSVIALFIMISFWKTPPQGIDTPPVIEVATSSVVDGFNDMKGCKAAGEKVANDLMKKYYDRHVFSLVYYSCIEKKK